MFAVLTAGLLISSPLYVVGIMVGVAILFSSDTSPLAIIGWAALLIAYPAIVVAWAVTLVNKCQNMPTMEDLRDDD